MSDILIQNELNQNIVIYDSFQEQDDDKNYYGTLKKLKQVTSKSSVSITPLHGSVNTLVVFDQEQKPLARFRSLFGKNSFVVSDGDVEAMKQAMTFVDYIGKNPTSDLATKIKELKAPKAIDTFFSEQPDYNKITADTYMMALTYVAAHPDTKTKAPEERTYSLSTFISYLSGKPYPEGMPDIVISKFFYHDVNDIFEFGGVIKLQDFTFKDAPIENIIFGLLPSSDELNFKVVFDLQVGANIGGTKLEFFYKELEIPLGGKNKLKINYPTISLSINPLFKFVIFEVSADFPFTLFDHKYDTKLSMVIDNIEVEVGFDIKGDHNSFPAPASMSGLHFDEFGFGMGILFEPPGYELGLSGKFHVGEGTNVVSLDDDTFALILDLEGEIPNPVYLSFYVPKFDLPTLIELFTDIKLSIDLPIHFSDLSFTWSENPLEPLALPDGTMTKGGYAFSGYMDVFGIQFFADIELNLQKIKGVATMSPLNMGEVLKLKGDGKEIKMKFDSNGNPIKNNTIAKKASERQAIQEANTKTIIQAGGPEMTISTEGSPYFTLNAQVSLLELIDEKIIATVEKDAISFDLDYGLLIKEHMSCKIKSSGNFNGNFSFGPDLKIPLPNPLGSIHLLATIGAALGLTISKEEIDFSVSGKFNFEGIDMSFGPAVLDVKISRISDVISQCGTYLIDHATEIFDEILKHATKWAGIVLKGTITEVENIASGLKTYFNQEINDAAKILNHIGMNPNKAASDLKAAFSADANVLAGALRIGFGLQGQATVLILKELDYSADEIGGVLHSVFGLDGKAAAQVLKDVGIPLQQITTVLSDIFSLSPNTISDVLKGVGFPITLISDVFKAIGGPFASVGEALSDALDKVTHYANPSKW